MGVLPADITTGLLWKDLARITHLAPTAKTGTTAPMTERKTMAIKALRKLYEQSFMPAEPSRTFT